MSAVKQLCDICFDWVDKVDGVRQRPVACASATTAQRAVQAAPESGMAASLEPVELPVQDAPLQLRQSL
eukprot:2714780-Prorocentrum_lima.AAC.1